MTESAEALPAKNSAGPKPRPARWVVALTVLWIVRSLFEIRRGCMGMDLLANKPLLFDRSLALLTYVGFPLAACAWWYAVSKTHDRRRWFSRIPGYFVFCLASLLPVPAYMVGLATVAERSQEGLPPTFTLYLIAIPVSVGIAVVLIAVAYRLVFQPSKGTSVTSSVIGPTVIFGLFLATAVASGLALVMIHPHDDDQDRNPLSGKWDYGAGSDEVNFLITVNGSEVVITEVNIWGKSKVRYRLTLEQGGLRAHGFHFGLTKDPVQCKAEITPDYKRILLEDMIPDGINSVVGLTKRK